MTDAPIPQYSSGRDALRQALAERIETNPLGWLPVIGDCINITFTPDEAKLLTAALRSSPAPQAQAGETNTDAEPSRCKNPVARGESTETDALTGDAPVASVSTLHAVAQATRDRRKDTIMGAFGDNSLALREDTAQGQSDRGDDDPYITDLKFAIEQNIKAARKYKARLDFMEVKYGAIDWDGTASQPASLPAGENLDKIADNLIGIQEDLTSEAARNHVGIAVHYLRKAASPVPSTYQSAPVFKASHHSRDSGEGDPPATVDCAGADTSSAHSSTDGATR